MIALLMLASAVQHPGPGTITVHSRDYLSLEQQAQVITGTCDGIPSSARILKARKGTAGTIELRHANRSRAVPSTFADGLLVRNTAYAVGLGCDGTRLLLVAYIVQMKRSGATRYFSQTATWDFGADQLTVSEPVDETAEEFAAHVQ
jgi:hypothetical protein